MNFFGLFNDARDSLPTKTFRRGELTVVCASPANVKLELQKIHAQDPFAEYCEAYFDARTKTIYVPWSNDKDINGKPLPDFTNLGHELWHYYAGWFHGGNDLSGVSFTTSEVLK